MAFDERRAKLPRLHFEPSTSKKSQSIQKEQEIENCFLKSKDIFPLANVDHLQLHAKKLAGNHNALEDFIVKHLDKEIEAPVLDNEHHLKTHADAFPNVDTKFLQEHVINTYLPEKRIKQSKTNPRLNQEKIQTLKEVKP